MKNQIFGIDFGTTNSSICYADQLGHAQVVPNANNELSTPSVVFFEDAQHLVVGAAAKHIASIYLGQAVFAVKRTLGESHKRFPFNQVSFRPQDIASFVLRKIAMDAENHCGTLVRDVVLTVPAHFGLNQKAAIKQAGQLAGFNVRYVIPEPVAAAIAYGLASQEDQNVLVYDLGGGTFEASLIEIKGGQFSVIAALGDHYLGGNDWDEVIANYLAESYSAATGTPYGNLLNNPDTWHDLLLTSERAKKTLTQRQSTLEKVIHGGERVTLKLTREKMEQLTFPLLNRTLSLTDNLIANAKNRGFSRVDQILLVGGSCFMPQVANALRARYSKPLRIYEPHQAVAKGAAIYGFHLQLRQEVSAVLAKMTDQPVSMIDLSNISEADMTSAELQVAEHLHMSFPEFKKLLDFEVVNIAAKSFGIAVVSNDGEDRVHNLIKVGDRIPVTYRRLFYTFEDDQSGVILRCFENMQRFGPDDPPIALIEGQCIGELELDFPASMPRMTPIEVTFMLSEDGLLKVEARETVSGTNVKAQFVTQALLKEARVASRIQRNLGIQIS